jgi:hypothetical protein
VLSIANAAGGALACPERAPPWHHPHQALVREDAQGPVTVLASVVLLASPA